MTPAEAVKPTQTKIMDTTKSPTELAAVPLFGWLEVHWDDMNDQWTLWRKRPEFRNKQRLRPMLASSVAMLSRKGLLRRYGHSDALTVTLPNATAQTPPETALKP